MTSNITTAETKSDTGTNAKYCKLSLPPPPPPPMTCTPRESFDPKESIPSSLSTSPTSSTEEIITNASSAAFSTSMSSLSTAATATPTPTPTHTKKVSQTKTVDLLHLASTTLASTIIASKIIQKHSLLLSSSPTSSSSSSPSSSTKTNNTELRPSPTRSISKPRIKDDGSIVTDADGESQRIITSYIKSISSQIRIVGEESNDEIQISHVEYQRTVNSWLGVGGSMHNNHKNANNAYPSSGCVSPGSKRKLLRKEKVDEDYICDYVKMEIESRHRSYSTEMKIKKDKNTMKQSDCNNCDENHPQVEDKNYRTNDFDFGHDHAVHVDPSRVSVYVDPLDGTSAYAKGQYEAVTILAGIMLDNVPIFGIIVKPFGHDGYNINFQEEKQGQQIQQGYHENDNRSSPRLSPLSTAMGFQFPCSAMYGGTLIGGAFILSRNELDRSRIYRTQTVALSSSPQSMPSLSSTASITTTSTSATTTNQYSQRKAIISKSRGGGVVRQCIDSLSSKGLLHPEPIYITGAGYKTMRLVLGTFNETMWFFPKPGTSLWDVAAADALLRVMGGRLSDKFGHDLDYSKSRADANNLDGIIACSDVNLHKKCLQLYHDECWDDEDNGA